MKLPAFIITSFLVLVILNVPNVAGSEQERTETISDTVQPEIEIRKAKFSQDQNKNEPRVQRQATTEISLEKRKRVYNILAVFPYQGKSHSMFLESFLKVLLKDGHKVTSITSLPMKEKFTNHHQITFTPTISSWADLFEFELMTSQTGWEARDDLERLSESFMYPLYDSLDFKKLLNGEEKFDVVLLETFFMQEALVFLGHRFQCPIISLATTGTISVQDLYMGRPSNPALETEWTTCATEPTMNFYQRITNTFSWIVHTLEHSLYYLPKREADLHYRISYPGMESLPPIKQLLRRISLTFSNTHPLLEHPKPQPLQLVNIPGLHISKDVTLPDNFRRLMDEAKDGVVLFTMGTMVPVSKMKKEKEIFIRGLSKLKQLVIWKSDIDIPELPSNIRVFKWLPQQAILAHNNCRAFITHGGSLGKQEALYYGVPLVTIPLFGDQQSNAGHSQATGFGVTLQYYAVIEENLVSAVNSVIYESRYKEKISKNSKIFREAVTHSEDKVLYWLKHVIEYDGASYLRRDSVELYWFQYYLLDVFATFILIAILLMFIMVKCAQSLCRMRFPKKVDIKKTKYQ